jgi:hypothetical protein
MSTGWDDNLFHGTIILNDPKELNLILRGKRIEVKIALSLSSLRETL